MQRNLGFFYLSSLVFLLPVLAAWSRAEWFYLFLATGCLVFSLLFHYEHRPKYWPLSFLHKQRKNIYFRVLDWMFATVSFVYMFIYVYKSPHQEYANVFYLLLGTAILIFSLSFFFFKRKYYHAVHPYFHVLIGLTATAVVLLM